MLDQMQEESVMPLLSALLAHPEFQAGVCEGQEVFEESYEPAPLTEEEMIEEVEMNLSQRVTERSRAVCQYHGWDPSSYLYNLGVVIGTIGKGLSYA
jgi:hypothetical protein